VRKRVSEREMERSVSNVNVCTQRYRFIIIYVPSTVNGGRRTAN